MDLEGKWKAILIGGLITGLAPFVPFVHLACCLIPITGAIVAVAIYRGSVPPPAVTNNDGIVLGAMTGVVGTVIYAVLIVPLAMLLGGTIGGFAGRILPSLTDVPRDVRPILEGVLANLGNVIVLILIFKILSQLALSLIFGIVGGLIGVALFRRQSSA